MNVTTAPTSSSLGRPLRTPGSAIPTAAASAANDPSCRLECATSTVNRSHGISAMKIALPPALGSALSHLLDDMTVSFRLMWWLIAMPELSRRPARTSCVADYVIGPGARGIVGRPPESKGALAIWTGRLRSSCSR